jgi:hypothetical protein
MPEKTEERKWSDYDACAAVEGFDGEEHTEEELIEAWQSLINSGIVWNLQGWYGRTAKRLIDEGLCHAKR